MASFCGAYTAIVTPFTADGNAVDLDRLTDLVERQADGGITGVVPCGTTGETPTLTDAEHAAVVERTVEVAHRRGLSVIAGAGSYSTLRAVELHRRVHASGADGALHVCPYYNKPCQEGLYRHFMAIAESCDLPIVLYNIPGRTGVRLEIETIVRLAQHPNIVAIKDATGSLQMTSDAVARTELDVLSGDDPLTLAMMAVGAVGVVSVLSNVLPDRVAGMCRAAGSGDFDTARSIHTELLPLAEALLTLGPNPVPLKAALKLLGHDNGNVRLPLVSAGREIEARLELLLKAHKPSPVGV